MKTVWPGRSVTDPRAATRLATAADDFQPVAPTHPYLRCRPVAATVIVVIRERHDANVQSVQQVDAADGPEWPLQDHAFVENSIQEVDQRIESQGDGHNVRILSLAKRSPKSSLRWARHARSVEDGAAMRRHRLPTSPPVRSSASTRILEVEASLSHLPRS